VTFVSLNIKELLNSKVSLLAGVKETIIASFCFGTFWYFSETLSESTGWLATSFIVKVISLVLLFSWFLLKKQSVGIKKQNLNLFPLIALIGILEAGAVASVNYGIAVGDLILVSPISSALSVVTITLAVIFLKEKISKLQLAGIILTICGIILTAF
jgi:drug/metabolite transporter (DMT)-like permease